MTKIILDAMGSDDCPAPEVEASIKAINELKVEIVLIGKKDLIEKELNKQGAKNSGIDIIHANDAITMDDHIEEARGKKDNSMRIGLDLLKSGGGDAFVTAGNTGMAMYYAIKVLGNLSGLDRPALCSLFPVKKGHCVVLDIGANAECRPEFLLQFAKMGRAYSKSMLNTTNPRIGILSNGEEEGKGNNLVREAFILFKKEVQNFIGNVEGKELFLGDVDVVITDGFTGNVLLKSSEAVAKLIIEKLKEGFLSSTRTKIGAFLAKPAFLHVKKMLDPADIGAAPLLGVNGLVFIGHGRSDAKAMLSSIKMAKNAISNNLLKSLKNSLN